MLEWIEYLEKNKFKKYTQGNHTPYYGDTEYYRQHGDFIESVAWDQLMEDFVIWSLWHKNDWKNPDRVCSCCGLYEKNIASIMEFETINVAELLSNVKVYNITTTFATVEPRWETLEEVQKNIADIVDDYDMFWDVTSINAKVDNRKKTILPKPGTGTIMTKGGRL